MLEGARAGVHQGVLPAAEAFIRRCDKLLGVTGPPDLCLSLCITKLEYNKAKLTRVSTESEESDIVSRSLSLLDSVLGVNGLTVEGNLRAELLLADGWWRERKGRGALTKVIQESYTGAVEVPDSNGKVYAQAYLRLAELAEGAGEVAAAIQHSLCAVTADPTLGLGCIGKVIHLLGKSEAASSVFLDASKSVPLWTFLPWVSQFLAMLTQPARSRNVVSFLEKMAEEYPQALFFPVRVSKVSFGEREMRLSGPLLQRVANPSLEAFSEALLGLDNPELRFFTGMRLVKRLMDEKEESRAKSEAERLLSECLSSSRTGLGGNIGTYNKNFAQRNHAEEFRTDLIDAPSLQGSNVNKWLKKASEWKSKMSSRVEVADLALFSGWLAEYDPCKHSIEVPGQYAEQMVSPPRVEYHAKITGFSKEVLVMQSLRRPKRLTIYASDGTAKAFLVKGGEDLRLDERIQRIFCAMNSSFQDDPACARARLRVNTINVVPLSPRLGMIEWVKNSLPLKAVMKSQVGDDVDRSSAPFYKLMRNDMSAEKFHRLFTKGQDYVVPTYRSCRDAVPRGILRSHLLAMGPSAEVFITLRDTFVKSLSVFNICSYVAGVGDRHLENFLIQEQTGAIVGIDFGAAFGHATTTLPVPELIPFRLTPQFSSVMTPLKTTLLMEHYMLSSLRALQCNSSVIVDMLDVFIAEPIVDWTGGVAVVFGEQKGGESGLQEAGSLSTARAEISLKVLSSRRKLQGWHPAALIEDDLSRNSYVEKYRTLDQLSLAVWADDRPERGSWMKEGCSKRLSPEDQIARLISIASDENVLGRSWVGLKTWL
jgi:DNA-dependent protein kinase catalytic subunit